MIRKCIIYFLFVGAAFFAGCVREDASDCETVVTLSYVYEHHNYRGDRFGDEVAHLHVFVYDGAGMLVDEYRGESGSLLNGNAVKFTLGPGEYTAVAWANTHTGNFYLENKEYFDVADLGVSCKDDAGIINTAEPGSLFHAMSRFTVEDGKPFNETIGLIKNSNFINIRVTGIDDITAGSVETVITGSNGSYSFDNSIHPDSRQVTYISDQSFEEGGCLWKNYRFTGSLWRIATFI